MAQIKIYALRDRLSSHGQLISRAIHQASIEVLGLPIEKRFHRLISLEPEFFLYPEDRSVHYVIIEISLFEGRLPETKKTYIRRILELVSQQSQCSVQDIEVTLFETPRMNWGIRGVTGDELALAYKVKT